MSSNACHSLGAGNYWEASFESEHNINAGFWKGKKQQGAYLSCQVSINDLRILYQTNDFQKHGYI